ncbi:hypothetical protein, partial [Escherichia coli]|uniref:hypothetical protein n=1 Tax=Escherichia coli TaxID=562 RepID=UPI00207C73B8
INSWPSRKCLRNRMFLFRNVSYMKIKLQKEISPPHLLVGKLGLRHEVFDALVVRVDIMNGVPSK